MRLARILSLRVLLFTVHVTLFSRITVGQDCNGVYIDFQCHTFNGLNDYPWLDADAKCAERYTIPGYMGSHLTSIGSAQKQLDIQDFMRRYGMRGAWVGATNKPLLWQWVVNKHDLQAQGCYNDSTHFSYKVEISGLSSEGCIDACNIANFGYAGIQNGGRCVCSQDLDSSTMTVGCNSSCSAPTSLSKWCGGPGNLTTVYRIGGSNGLWGYNQPDMVPSQKSCAVLDMDLETKMADENCSMTYDFLCQMNSSTCDGPGYQKLSQLCYYVSRNGSVDWTTARNKCRNDLNGDLAVVDNNFLQAALGQWLSTVFPSQNRKIWVGAYKGGWHWFAEYSFSYTNWAEGQPTESDENQCLFVDQTINYQWLALPCTQSKLSICQRGYNVFTTPALNWIGPTQPTGTGGTGNTGVTGITGGPGSTSGTGGTGGPGSTLGTGNTGGTIGTGSTGNTGGTGSSQRWSTSPSLLFNNSTANYSTPEVGADRVATNTGWSNLAIGLFALLAIILFLLLLLALLLCARWIAKNRSGNKIDYAHHHDARPIAHVPNSGENFASTTSLKNAAAPVGKG